MNNILNKGGNYTDMEELFRHKLENNEIIPSPDVSQKLMRRLALREFMRFNPFQFNIYYAGLIVAGIVAMGALLFSGQEEEPAGDQSIQQSDSTGITIQKSNPFVVDTAVTPDNEKTDKTGYAPSSSDTVTSINEVDRSLIKGSEINATPGIPLNVSEVYNDRRLRGKANMTVSFMPSVQAGCVPLSIHFEPGDEYDSYNWSFGDGGNSTKRNPDWIFEKEGSYNVVLTATSQGATADYSSTVTVYPKPVASFSIYPESPVLPDDKISFRNFSTNAVSFKWNFGDGRSSTEFEPEHRYDKYLSYTVSLTVFSEHGCIDSTSKADIFSGTDYYINMPNAFIPNINGPSGGFYSASTDEKAEIFHPVCYGVSEYQFSIYSKLGILLFDTRDVNVGWDGYFKGQLSNPGVYIWKIKGQFRNGESFSRMGDVTLIKK